MHASLLLEAERIQSSLPCLSPEPTVEMSNIINRSELERIKASILPSIEDNSKIERKRELKKKSEDRLKNWPNTLEALRLKKESFMKDREAEEEAKRQEVDREVSLSTSVLIAAYCHFMITAALLPLIVWFSVSHSVPLLNTHTTGSRNTATGAPRSHPEGQRPDLRPD